MVENPVNWTTIALGMAMIAYGLFTTILRAKRPQMFRKMEPMKRRWGARTGFWIHLVAYSIVPIVGGALIAFSGTGGASLF